MAEVTEKPRGSRVIKLLSINDAHVHQFLDEGMQRDGSGPHVRRAQIMNAIAKSVDVGGQPLPVFVLAEEPTPLFPGDPFDRDVIRDRKGNLLVAFPEWTAERNRRIAAHAERTDATKKLLDKRNSEAITKSLVDLVKRDDDAKAAPPATPKAKEKQP